MNIAKLVLAGTAALTIVSSSALAQQDNKQETSGQEKSGQVTQVNRLNNTVSIRQVQSGTVGSSAASPEETFKVKEGVSLEDLHAGNRITYSTTDQGGTKTLTTFKVQ